MTALAIKAAPKDKHTIIDALDDEALFAPSFRGDSWNGWRAILKAAMCLPMTADEIVFFKSVAGGRDPPTKPVRELWVAAGRRTGKDSVASALGGHAAALFSDQHRLRGGEKPLVALLACSREQSGIVLSYLKSYFTDIPMLSSMVTRETATGFELSNNVEVSVTTNNFRTAGRGRAILMAILDEVAFYRSDTSTTPDIETYKAILPAMATLPGSMLIGISSPYRKAGLLYQKYRDHFGKPGDILVIQAATSTLNPLIDPEIIRQSYEDDPQEASASWGGLFRDDIGAYIDPALVESAVDVAVLSRPPRQGIVYKSFCDPSGGQHDSFCAAIAHKEDGVAILDCIVEIKAPCNPAEAARKVADVLKGYRLRETTGDKYGSGFTVSAFAAHGINYRHADKDRSSIYLELLPLLSSARVRLLDSLRLKRQLQGLERRTSPVGKDAVSKPPGGFDDLINAAAGALVLASRGTGAVMCGAIVVSSGPRSFPGSDTSTGALARVWERTIRGPT
jgi:hypothetical protein